jgi:hypothetical protein
VTLHSIEDIERGHRDSPTYRELLHCTNEVLRAILPLRIDYNGDGFRRFDFSRWHLDEAEKQLQADRKLFTKMFGSKAVHDAKALLWVLRRDMGEAVWVSYGNDPDGYVATLD